MRKFLLMAAALLGSVAASAQMFLVCDSMYKQQIEDNGFITICKKTMKKIKKEQNRAQENFSFHSWSYGYYDNLATASNEYITIGLVNGYIDDVYIYGIASRAKDEEWSKSYIKEALSQAYFAKNNRKAAVIEI